MMRYIGSKFATLSAIESIIDAFAPRATSLCDPFAGTCTVARHFKKRGLRIETGDLLWTSHVFQLATIALNRTPNFRRLLAELKLEVVDKDVTPAEMIVRSLDRLPGCGGYVTESFSDHGKDGRRFFTEDNATRIDAVRSRILDWRTNGLLSMNDEAYLLACLLEAADRVANTAGTYMAHLKSWTRKALKPLSLRAIPIDDNGFVNRCSRRDARQTAETDADVLYLDPPYNSRDYSFYYHVPESIVLWDQAEPTGKSGVPATRRHPLSDFCVRRRAASALDELLSQSRANFIVFHYATNGFILHDEIMDMLQARVDAGFQDLRVRGYSSRASDGDAAEAHHRIYWCHAGRRSD